MKALVYTGKEQLEVQEVADPVAHNDQALIRIESVGICGSDMHAYLGHDERRPAPLILGHEAAGTVIDGPLKGKRVTVNPLVNCRHCEYCNQRRENLCQNRQIISMPPREGAFAQLLTMPVSNLIEVPDATALSKAALTEPIACGWHGVRLARQSMTVSPNEAHALVLGGGAIGVGAALALKAQGFEHIIIAEPHPGRRNFVLKNTGLNCCDPKGFANNGEFDLVIDAVGYSATRKNASDLVKPGGLIIHIGLGEAEGGLDIRRMTLHEITFIGTYTYTAQDFRETAQAIFDGRMGPLDWIEERPLCEGAAAFSDLHHGKVDAPKIILKP